MHAKWCINDSRLAELISFEERGSLSTILRLALKTPTQASVLETATAGIHRRATEARQECFDDETMSVPGDGSFDAERGS